MQRFFITIIFVFISFVLKAQFTPNTHERFYFSHSATVGHKKYFHFGIVKDGVNLRGMRLVVIIDYKESFILNEIDDRYNQYGLKTNITNYDISYEAQYSTEDMYNHKIYDFFDYNDKLPRNVSETIAEKCHFK